MPEAATRQFVEIQQIRNDVLILKDGSLRQVIKVGSMNFELKSQDEQIAILRGFRNFLNTLDFSLEIMVMSRKLNIKNYLKTLDQIIENQQNELLRIQASDYSKFVKELTQLTNIMGKEFFVTVPFYISPATGKGTKDMIKTLFKPAQVIQELTPEEFDSYKTQLGQRVNLVFENLLGLGLAPRILNGEELLNLCYKFYNPEAVEKIKIE